MKSVAAQEVVQMAKGLGISGDERPEENIVEFCHEKVRSWLPSGNSPSDIDKLEALICKKLQLVIREVWTDEQLNDLVSEYTSQGDWIFAKLPHDLDATTYAALRERTMATARSHDRYIAIIDCRGIKATRRFFSRWHEIAHLLTLYDQLELSFNRRGDDAVERLMDQIAGEIGFYPPIFNPLLKAQLGTKGYLAFADIDEIRSKFHETASFQSTLFTCVRRMPFAAVVVEARPSLSKNEKATQPTSGENKAPQKKLRVVQIIPNEAGKKFSLHAHLRVPEASVLSKVFYAGESGQFCESYRVENTDWWDCSGTRLPCHTVHVEARRAGDSAIGLIQEVVRRPKTISLR